MILGQGDRSDSGRMMLIVKEEKEQMRTERNGRVDRAFIQNPHFLYSTS